MRFLGSSYLLIIICLLTHGNYFAQSVVYSEDFSNAPDFEINYSVEQGEYFQWDSDEEIYKIRLRERHDVYKFAYSENFEIIDNKSFTVSVDMYVKESSFGFPMGLRLVETGQAEGLSIYHNGSQDPFFVINDGNTNTFNTPYVQYNTWYRIKINFNNVISSADIEVNNRETGEIIYSVQEVNFEPVKFNRFALGWHTLNSDGSWGEIFYDNLFVSIVQDNYNVLAHWDFNEMSGDILNDRSGNGHNGNIVNPNWTSGQDEGALKFNGVNTEVNVPSGSAFGGFNELTVEAVVKISEMPQPGEYRWIVGVYDEFKGFNSSTMQTFWLGLVNRNGNNELHFGVRTDANARYDGRGVAYQSNTIPLNQWIHIAGVYDHGTLKIYLNGEEKAEHYHPDAKLKVSNTDLTIGWARGTDNDNVGGNTYFDGYIDDIIIKNSTEVVTNIENINNEGIEKRFILCYNYPNPFNPTTVITYQLPEATHVILKVYNILGEEITTLIDEYKQSGRYNVEFNASNLVSGIYIYKLEAGNFIDVKKMVLMR